jgi:hypothetical protein
MSRETIRITAPSIPPYDIVEANRLIDQAFESRGWLLTGDDGEPVHDMEKMRHAVFVAFTTEHIVTSTNAKSGRRAFDQQVAEAAVTKFGLYVEVFPDGPAAKGAPASAEEQAAKEQIAAKLWSLCTSTNRKGWLQREVGPSGLVVLETKVFSDDPTTPPQAGRFVTNVDHAMMDFLDHKVFEDVRKKLLEMDAWLGTFYQRNPNIALPAARKAKAALKAAVDSAAHANPTYVRESLALTSGDPGTDAAESDG